MFYVLEVCGTLGDTDVRIVFLLGFVRKSTISDFLMVDVELFGDAARSVADPSGE